MNDRLLVPLMLASLLLGMFVGSKLAVGVDVTPVSTTCDGGRDG